jgi:hypothetical protein
MALGPVRLEPCALGSIVWVLLEHCTFFRGNAFAAGE